MEIFLPVALKLFPNMLPSTFRDELKHEEELKRKLKAKIEVAKFLQDTVKVMAKGLKHSSSGVKREKADALYEFMNAVRSGKAVTNEQIVRFAKLFNDDFTLDNINRTQLVNMCKFVGISPYGTDTFLRFQLRNKLREIKQDDRLIQLEGVEGLSDEELKSAARTRGMRWEEDRKELERQLKDWLELSLQNNLPKFSVDSKSCAFNHARKGRGHTNGDVEGHHGYFGEFTGRSGHAGLRRDGDGARVQQRGVQEKVGVFDARRERRSNKKPKIRKREKND